MASPLSILIVDDEEELATLFKNFLEARSMDAVSFTNPLLAFEYCKDNQQKFSLVITDLRMPGMCGLEFANKIRELNNSIKIFLITAFETADLESIETYQSAKIDRVIQKPIKLSILKNIIDETFSN
ncbi:MAG TPA: response regulator [Candidatus Nitrosocosmicus sp.]|nr:response regulator [Candidatus Nitrosocosmicus sp.]